MAIDGRSSRWDEHRATRRAELVSHALRAIRVQGPHIGMDDIATRAGTSKTVLYRHFGDREGLHDAVVESVHQYIRDGVLAALETTEPADVSVMTHTLASTYLNLVERDPHIYRFVMNGPGVAGASTGGRVPVVIASAIADLLESRLPGVSQRRARTWGFGLVGFIQAAADEWMDDSAPAPRADVVDDICAAFTPAFSHIPTTTVSTHPTPAGT